MALVDAGADAVKVGIGPGSICTTRVVAGVACRNLRRRERRAALAPHGVPLIADGGIRFSGDVASDRRRRLLRDDRRPVRRHRGVAGEVELYQARPNKSYRGMGSLGAMAQAHGSRDRYFQDTTMELEKLVPEGVEGRVPYKGSIVAILHQLTAACAPRWLHRSGSIDEMRTGRSSCASPARDARDHVHDVTITKEAPNYRVS